MTVRYVYDNASSIGDNLTFNNGQTNGVETYQNYYQYLGTGSEDDTWDITQWLVTSYFNPDAGLYGDIDYADSELSGLPVVSFVEGATSDAAGYERLSLYTVNAGTKLATLNGSSTIQEDLSTTADASSKAGDDVSTSSSYNHLYGYVYSMTDAGGAQSDVMLQTKTIEDSGLVTFNHQLTYTAYEDIEASSGTTGQGIVYGGNNFTVNFSDGSQSLGIFLQVNLWDSRGQGEVEMFYDTLDGSSSSGKILSISDNRGTWDSDVLTTIGAGLHKVTININAALDVLIKELSEQDPTHASAYQNLADWSLSGSYEGLESGPDGSVSDNSATMDVADATITSDDSSTVTYSADAQKVQTIDDNVTATTLSTITTTADGSDNILLDADGTSQTVSSLGSDTFTTTMTDLATIAGTGSSLTVAGEAGSSDTTGTGSVTITAGASTVLTVSGTFDDLSVTGHNAADSVSATVEGTATLDMMAGSVSIVTDSMQASTVTFTSGSDASFSLDTETATAVTVMTSNDTGVIHNSAAATQVIVSSDRTSSDASNVMTVHGGGAQQIWTGQQDYSIDADGNGGTVSSVFTGVSSSTTNIYAGVQGGTATVNLDDEMVTAWDYSGQATINGSTAATASDALVVSDGGHVTINGGTEDLWYVAFTKESTPDDITAGSGQQTLFVDSDNQVVNGGTASGGSQVIVGSQNTLNNDGVSTTVNGGAADQSIYTGSKDFTVNAAASSTAGSLVIDQQGGATTFNANDQDATFYAYGGSSSTLNLGTGTGDVSIQGNASVATTLTLNDFRSGVDTLRMIGMASNDDYSVAYGSDDTTITFGGGATLVLNGTTHVGIVDLSSTAIQITS